MIFPTKAFNAETAHFLEINETAYLQTFLEINIPLGLGSYASNTVEIQ